MDPLTTVLPATLNITAVTDETLTDNSSEEFQGYCDVIPNPQSIIILVVYIGPIIAIVSCVENLLIFLTLVHKSKYYRSHFLYLLLLAFWDVTISITYLFMFPVDVLRDEYDSVWLSNAWLTYLPVAFTVGQYSTTATTYFILCATFERFLIEANFKIKPNGNCTGIRKHLPWPSDLAITPSYTIYKFYVRVLGSDVLPFIFICIFNFYIASKLRTLTRRAKLFRMHTRDKFIWSLWTTCVMAGYTSITVLCILYYYNQFQMDHEMDVKKWSTIGGTGGNYRVIMRLALANQLDVSWFEEQAALASRMLVVMVMTYLLSKLLNFILVVWEFLDVDSLLYYEDFYRHSSQFSNLLALLGCSSRLPIYLVFNSEFRAVFCRDLRRYLNTFFCPGFMSRAFDDPASVVTNPAVNGYDSNDTIPNSSSITTNLGPSQQVLNNNNNNSNNHNTTTTTNNDNNANNNANNDNNLNNNANNNNNNHPNNNHNHNNNNTNNTNNNNKNKSNSISNNSNTHNHSHSKWGCLGETAKSPKSHKPKRNVRNNDFDETDALLLEYPLSTAEYIARKHGHPTFRMGGGIETIILKSIVRKSSTNGEIISRVPEKNSMMPKENDNLMTVNNVTKSDSVPLGNVTFEDEKRESAKLHLSLRTPPKAEVELMTPTPESPAVEITRL